MDTPIAWNTLDRMDVPNKKNPVFQKMRSPIQKRKIGCGSTSTVWADRRTDKSVAVKYVKIEDAYRREKFAFQKIGNHSGLVKVFSMRQCKITMDLLGRTPQEVGCVLTSDVLRMSLRNAFSLLEHMHALEMVHGDIGRANIGWTADGFKIFDLGNWQEVGNRIDMCTTSIAYRPPEQMFQTGLFYTATCASDVFSLTVLGIELAMEAAMHKAYAGEHIPEKSWQHLVGYNGRMMRQILWDRFPDDEMQRLAEKGVRMYWEYVQTPGVLQTWRMQQPFLYRNIWQACEYRWGPSAAALLHLYGQDRAPAALSDLFADVPAAGQGWAFDSEVLAMGFGVPVDVMTDFLEKALAWSPQKRMTAAEALEHPFLN